MRHLQQRFPQSSQGSVWHGIPRKSRTSVASLGHGRCGYKRSEAESYNMSVHHKLLFNF